MNKIKAGLTGGGGYAGNVLCRQLLDLGIEVKVMDNFHKGQCDALIGLMGNPNFAFQYGDVTNELDVEKFTQDLDVVFHLAAIVGFPACDRQPFLATKVNVDGTKNVVKYCKKRGIPIVNFSSGSTYGAISGICTEESPLNTTTIYGLNKKEAEQIVAEIDNSVSMRFATGFGLGETVRVNLLVNDLVYQAVHNRVIDVFEKNARRTFIHVRDMSKAAILCMQKLLTNGLKYKVYNVGDNNMNCTKGGLTEMVREKTGCFVNYIEFGKDKDCRDYEVDYSKINAEGFKCSISLEQGIDELIKAAPLIYIRNRFE